MIFKFDAFSLGHLIALCVKAVLDEHGIEMTKDDEDVAGTAAGDFLRAIQAHKEEQAQMVESVKRDLDDLPTVDELQRRAPSWRPLGMDPPV